jgi:hypothetical protein
MLSSKDEEKKLNKSKALNCKSSGESIFFVPLWRGKPERRGWIKYKLEVYPPPPCGHIPQGRTIF